VKHERERGGESGTQG